VRWNSEINISGTEKTVFPERSLRKQNNFLPQNEGGEVPIQAEDFLRRRSRPKSENPEVLHLLSSSQRFTPGQKQTGAKDKAKSQVSWEEG